MLYRFVLFLILYLLPSVVHSANIKDLYEKAVDAFNAQQYDSSIEFYQSIVNVMPSFAPALNGIGLAITARDSDYDEAIKYFQMAVRADGRYAQAFENLGRMFYAKGNYVKSQAYFEKALRLDSNLLGSLVSLGWIHLLVKADPPLAVTYFKRAYALDKNPNTYFALGMAYFSDNNRIAAIEVVTNLRAMSQEDLARQLEKSMRENRHVNADPVYKQRTSANEQEIGGSLSVQSKSNSANFSSVPDVKVRLQGKLEDL